MNAHEISIALKEALKLAGTQQKLAEKAQMSQGNLNGLLNGKNKIQNMTVGTLLRLFPDIKMHFFGSFQRENADPIEEQIFEIIQRMSVKEKVKCLTLIAANFSSIIQDNNHKDEPT